MLGQVYQFITRLPWGAPPYHPRMMVKVLLYGYCIGVSSSRRIAQRLHEDVASRVLMLCQRAGLVKLGHVALDGAKVRANASKHKAMSYKRMKEKEAQLTAEVAELLRRAQEVDEEEDCRYGRDKRGDELPEELAFREGRLEKIREAMAALEAEAQMAAEQAEAEGKEHPGVPDDKAQRNFTDAESRIMPAPGGRDFQQAYNCQAVVDHAHQVIVAARATNLTSDKQQAVVMIEETISNTGAVPKEVSADAGYYSAKAVEEISTLGVDPFIAPEQTCHGRVVSTRAPRSHTQSAVPQGPDAAEVADQVGPPALRPADGDGGAGLRPDPAAGPRLPPVPAAGSGEGPGRVVPDLHRPQPAQAVPLRPTGPRMSMGHPANRARGMSTPPVGNDVPCPEPPSVSIVNRQE